jgi:hypothetical protein
MRKKKELLSYLGAFEELIGVFWGFGDIFFISA